MGNCVSDKIRIGNMWVNNRIVMAPMNTNYSSASGELTPQMEEYYVRRAEGGAGLIVLEAVSVSPLSKNHGVQPMLYDEKYIPYWSNLIERLHSFGAKVSVEIAHFGSEASLPPRESASERSRFADADVHVLTKEEIKHVQESFAATVCNAKKAGADAVTLHGAHGYLIAEFMSPLYNNRTDEYGGSLENRLRFVTEIIEMCHERAGAAYPVIVRYSVNEFAEGGRTVQESAAAAKLLEAAGAAAIDLSAGIPNAYIFTNPPNSLGDTRNFLADWSKQVKDAVRIPVICANTIRKKEDVEDILANGKADMVAMARPMLADPDYARKALSGQWEDIRQCLSCQYCFKTLDGGKSLRCAVNPETGREYMYKGESGRTDSPMKILVIGGGAAGMETARSAALKGHEVVLCEKEDVLGGTVNTAAIPPHKEKLAGLVEWYERQLKKLCICVRKNTKVDDSLIEEIKPDIIVVAAGASYARRIPGSGGENVVTAVEALKHPELVGDNVVIIGGGATGCESAEYFSYRGTELRFKQVKGIDGELLYDKIIKESGRKGRNVTLLEMMPEIASDMDEFNGKVIKIVLKENGVDVLTSMMVEEIREGSVAVKSVLSGEKKVISADTVILAGGLCPEKVITEREIPVYWIGDSNKPGRIADALYDAYALVKRL